ncbi:CoA ester lyase [Breoghania sp.]|uniref:HpcH/HpaI aldolase/citrate lyase family protein n=1 Tax=Breoghania sp. TaxID=2065378 RepID=UPI002639242D|nr:CoA ester lyase [Breoghania sp.]MDJ0933669.1 CoA ester lyase [Breoghania sp.]
MRSLLFVPGDDTRKLIKGLVSGADVMLVDLEDSVAPDAKQKARETTRYFLRDTIAKPERPRLYARVNALDTGMTKTDLDAVMASAPEGILLPKATSGRDVERLDAMLSVHEADHNIKDGRTRIIVIATETAASLFTLGTYQSASKRLAGMAWGGEDLSADIGSTVNRANGEFTEPYRFARNLCLFGAVAAQVAPIDTVYTNFRDLDGLRAECEEAMRDGFTAKLAIHPAQVPVINDLFTPNAGEIERAARIAAVFEEAGDAGVIALDGEMLDRPHLTRARKLLDRARLAGVYA